MDPHVHIRQVLTSKGETIRLEKFLYAKAGMRYIDFEHELGHVSQLEKLKQPMPNEQVLANGRPYKGPEIPKVNIQRGAIIEYENRLQEFFRLRDRGVDPHVLEEHANGVRAARQLYADRMQRARSAGQNFVNQNFPHLPELDARFVREEGSAVTNYHAEGNNQ